MTADATEAGKTVPETRAQPVQALADAEVSERRAGSRTAPHGATEILRLITHGRNPLKGVPSFRAGRMSRTLRMRPLHQPARRNRQEPALNTIATVTGKLTLTIADSPAIDLGNIKIPISAKTNLRNDGELVLTATPNMRQVREFIEQAFLAADDINAIEEG